MSQQEEPSLDGASNQGRKKLTPKEWGEICAAIGSDWKIENTTPDELAQIRSQVQWMARSIFRDTADITPEEATRAAARGVLSTWKMLGAQSWNSANVAFWHKNTPWTRRGTHEDTALWEASPGGSETIDENLNGAPCRDQGAKNRK